MEPQGNRIMETKSRRGFAAMDQETQRSIASKGGKAAHQKGTAHQFTSDEARAAGRKGGETVSRNRLHMSAIGRKGGEAVSRDRAHMSAIGREGGQTSHAHRNPARPGADGSVGTSEEEATTARQMREDATESSYAGGGPGLPESGDGRPNSGPTASPRPADTTQGD
jgi:general stress protein YciG